MTIFLTVLITLAVVAAIIAGLVWYSRDEIRRQQQTYQAQLRTWQVQQAEYETEQRLREATRAAMNDMLSEARRHTDPNSRG